MIPGTWYQVDYCCCLLLLLALFVLLELDDITAGAFESPQHAVCCDIYALQPWKNQYLVSYEYVSYHIPGTWQPRWYHVQRTTCMCIRMRVHVTWSSGSVTTSGGGERVGECSVQNPIKSKKPNKKVVCSCANVPTHGASRRERRGNREGNQGQPCIRCSKHQRATCNDAGRMELSLSRRKPEIQLCC